MTDIKTDRQGDGPGLDLQQTQSILPAVKSMGPLREAVFVFIACMAQFMTQAGLGCTLSPLTIIGEDLGVHNDGILSWFIAGYSLTSGTFILFFGRCGDLIGYRPVFILGFAWFSLWSIVAGLSVYSNHILFIFARTLQGLGPAMLLPNALAILGSTYPPGTKKNMVFSLFGATAPNGAVVGAVFAALFSQLAWWPWTFWVCGIACAIFALVGCMVIPHIYHEPEHPPRTVKDWIQQLDVIGAALGVGGLVLVNVAWNQGPVAGWTTVYVYVVLIIGAVLLAFFFTWELWVATHPLIPLHALSLDVLYVLGCMACGWGSFGIWVYYFWLFLEHIRGNTPLLSAAQFAPPCISGLIAAFTTGYLMSRLRPAWIMLISMVAFALGVVFLAIAPVGQTYWALTFVSLVVTPWGMDMSFPASTVLLSDAVERHHQGIAASLVTTVVNYSISLGLGFAGTVEVHVNRGGKNFHDKLFGYRAALYMGIGLAGLGVATSLVYLVKTKVKRTTPSVEEGKKQPQ
ncbi:MFS transporter [Aspergillus candidus]|uniref:MFS general substrate transporter n=1 Tax=Aspergillus candidus TaxID=41067 RepID=A0A2I2FA33_ASPCN|nr:MFS general substrate transporter [Aspergillus candidus]PLB37490.1 MFS general substrate transporter [Aspergillus candidus]